VIDKYERSGNGSNQVSNDDSDVELDEEGEGEDRWGRFNAERAQRIAFPNGATSNGDDRASFLGHYPVDLLYSWHVFDMNSILHFTAALFSDEVSVSSLKTPGSVSDSSWKRKGQNNNESEKKSEADCKFLSKSIYGLQSGLNQNMLQTLKDKRYEIMLSLHQQTDAEVRQIMEDHSTDINQDIVKLESF
jgi:hypothetical protein